MSDLSSHPTTMFERDIPAATSRDWRWMGAAIARRWQMVALVAALAAGLAVAYVLLRPASYTAVALVKVYSLALSSSGENTFFAEAEFEPTFLETQIQSLTADPVVLGALKRMGTPVAEGDNPQGAILQFKRRLETSRVGQSSLVAVLFTDPDPVRAADAANAVIATYSERLRSDRDAAAVTAGNWLRERLREAGPRAQLVAPALPPVEKVGLRGLYIVPLAALAGTVVGIVLALALALLDRRIRTLEDAERATGLPCLGMVPVLRAGRSRKGTAPDAVPPAIARIGQRLAFASAPTRPRLVGITSLTPGEGRTTLAANLADAARRQGLRALLLKTEETGDEPRANAAVTPRPPGSALADATSATGEFDVVFVDLPPLLGGPELLACARELDSILLVVRQNHVSSSELDVALAMNPEIRERLAGTVLNRVRFSRAERLVLPEAVFLKRRQNFDAARLPA